MEHTALRLGSLTPALLTLALTGVLAGCVAPGGGGAVFAPSAAGKAAVGADVEAPEVFQVTDTALWDGRPSLGGIWVASADAVDPERVLMENLATGTTVEGALFRRERDNPGPALQISSDAAEALGILAGQPVEIRVTALRTAEVQPAVVEEIVPPADMAADGVAVEAEADTEAAGEPETADAEATAAAATAVLEATGAAGAEAAPATEVLPKTAKERRAEAKAAREAKKAAAATAKADAEAAATAAAPVDSAGVADIETAPLDARSADVSAAAAAAAVITPDPADAAKAVEVAPPDTPDTPDTAAVVAPETAPTTARPIQIATFSQEANATRAIADLAKIGVTAQVRKAEVGGKPVWGIMANGDVATLKSIRGAGYPDAYFLQ